MADGCGSVFLARSMETERMGRGSLLSTVMQPGIAEGRAHSPCVILAPWPSRAGLTSMAAPFPPTPAPAAAEKSRRGSGASAWSISSTSAGGLFRAASYVNWCRHGQEVIPWPREDGLVAFVPLIGEAR